MKHPDKYLGTKGEWRGNLPGTMEVDTWIEAFQKYRCSITSGSTWGNYHYVTYFSPEELDKDYWPTGLAGNVKCVCGSAAVNGPGHAYYCDLDSKRWEKK